uniref:Transcription factor TGA3 n=1 Tax=Cajanus cajan TaxID=3821 RepID=A0A151RVX9_CAJCA|nr:Transcription factor TGA3 [Cajanus cajan]
MDASDIALFEAFLQGWMERQRDYLDELITAQRHYHELQEDEIKQLINRVLNHYGQYFEEKSKIAQQDIILVFSPPWFSSLEKGFYWVGGFKPGMSFQLVNSAVPDLSETQKGRLTYLKQVTKVKERGINDDLAKLHEGWGAPPLLEMVRSHGRMCVTNSFHFRAADGTVPSSYKEKLEKMVASADALRTNTALKVVQILTPPQILAFLVGVAQFQIRVRTFGMDKDAQDAGKV